MKQGLLAACTAALLWASGAMAGPTLDGVKARGSLNCGVNAGLAGFALRGPDGQWAGLDADLCRALAAAVLGPQAKVSFVPLSASERFDALAQRRVDILFRNTTLTQTVDTRLNLDFSPIYFFDGQGFLVPGTVTATRFDALGAAKVCVQQGTTTEANLVEYIRRRRSEAQVVAHPTNAAAEQAFARGECTVLTADRSALAGVRAPAGAKYRMLDSVISREPFAAVLRQDDWQWADAVRWTIHALLIAEANEITQRNVDSNLTNSDPEVRRLLGVAPGFGRNMGLDDRWAFNAIKAVGNYAEIHDRHLGRLGIERGPNAL